MENPYDSIQLAQLMSLYELNNMEDYYYFFYETWNVPINVVKQYTQLILKLKSNLERETEGNHTIASRYYSLIKSDCLSSNLPLYFFEDEELGDFIVRKPCTFWGVFSTCGEAALTTFGACIAPNPVTIGLAIICVGDYIETVSKC
ncbi:MAG: hypothetical protein R2771_02540 [Saprospiraceae bacterium]